MLERGVDLIVARPQRPRGSRPASRGAPFSTTTSERVNSAAGLSPVAANTRWIGRSIDAPAGNADHRAVAHEGGVERDSRVVGLHDSAEPLGDGLVALGEHVGHGAKSSGRPRASQDRTAPARMRHRRTRGGGIRPSPSERPASFARAFAAASGGGASGLASRISARRSVYFHSSTRRCGSPVRANCANAASRKARRARQARSCGLPFGRELLLGGILHQASVSAMALLLVIRPRPPRPGNSA